MANMSYVKKAILTAACIALCVVLPMAFHSIPNAGSVFLPMHIPVLLCGLICGWPFGLLCGLGRAPAFQHSHLYACNGLSSQYAGRACCVWPDYRTHDAACPHQKHIRRSIRQPYHSHGGRQNRCGNHQGLDFFCRRVLHCSLDHWLFYYRMAWYSHPACLNPHHRICFGKSKINPRPVSKTPVIRSRK